MRQLGEAERVVMDPTALAMGDVSGTTPVRVVGRNPSVGTSFEMIWQNGGIYTGFLTPAQASTLEVIGLSANDTAMGSGCRSVYIEGLGWPGLNRVSETLATNGTSPSAPTQNTYIRVNAFEARGNGTRFAFNADRLTLRTTSDSTIMSIMEQSFGTGQNAIISAPTGHEAVVCKFTATSDQTGTATMRFQACIREGISETAAPYSSIRVIERFDGVRLIQDDDRCTFRVPPGSDFWMDAAMSAGSASVTGRFIYYLRAL